MNTKIIENRKARFDFTIKETMEVGVKLLGWEVKALKAGRVALVGSWVRRDLGVWVWEGEIAPLEQASSHEPAIPKRAKILLMKKRDAERWAMAVQKERMTVVPLKGYFKGRWFKLEIGLCQGKTHGDKRETVKARDETRRFEKSMPKNS